MPPIPAGIDTGEPFIGLSSPALLGLTAATGDPGTMPSQSTVLGALITAVLVPVGLSVQADNAYLSVVGAATGVVAPIQIGAYDLDWNLLGVSADISAQFGTVGLIRSPLTPSIPALPVNSYLYLALYGVCTTCNLTANRANGSNMPAAPEGPNMWRNRSSFTPAALPASLAGEMLAVTTPVIATPFLAVGP